jgi:hypothetical protein
MLTRKHAGLRQQWERNTLQKVYKEISVQRPTKDSTKPTLLEGEHENRRYWFARHCHKYGSTLAPSGISWDEVFERNEGITLKEYIKFAKENKLGEKYVQNKSR